MNAKIQVGIVGTSGWTDFMYLSNLAQDPLVNLAAICGGHNLERAEELARKYQIPGVYLDYRQMIKDAHLDALIVASPDDLHHPIVMEAIHAGLHILCDKPLSVTAAQSQEMYTAASEKGITHMVLFTYRWMPFFKYIKDLLEQGLIGAPYHCEFRYEMGYARGPEYQWRLDQERANGVLADLGSHMIDMAQWLIGDITHVQASLGVFVNRNGQAGRPLKPANDSAFMLQKFSNGAHGSMHVSVVAHMADRFMQQQIKLYGENGSLELDMPYDGAEKGPVIKVAGNADTRFRIMDIPASYWGSANPSDPFSVFKTQAVGCREFISAIANNQPCTPSFKDGWSVQRVIEAAMRSNETGTWTNISSI